MVINQQTKNNNQNGVLKMKKIISIIGLVCLAGTSAASAQQGSDSNNKVYRTGRGIVAYTVPVESASKFIGNDQRTKKGSIRENADDQIAAGGLREIKDDQVEIDGVEPSPQEREMKDVGDATLNPIFTSVPHSDKDNMSPRVDIK